MCARAANDLAASRIGPFQSDVSSHVAKESDSTMPCAVISWDALAKHSASERPSSARNAKPEVCNILLLHQYTSIG